MLRRMLRPRWQLPGHRAPKRCLSTTAPRPSPAVCTHAAPDTGTAPVPQLQRTPTRVCRATEHAHDHRQRSQGPTRLPPPVKGTVPPAQTTKTLTPSLPRFVSRPPSTLLCVLSWPPVVAHGCLLSPPPSHIASLKLFWGALLDISSWLLPSCLITLIALGPRQVCLVPAPRLLACAGVPVSGWLCSLACLLSFFLGEKKNHFAGTHSTLKRHKKQNKKKQNKKKKKKKKKQEGGGVVGWLWEGEGIASCV